LLPVFHLAQLANHDDTRGTGLCVNGVVVAVCTRRESTCAADTEGGGEHPTHNLSHFRLVLIVYCYSTFVIWNVAVQVAQAAQCLPD
jgi:hypothetical protein